MKVKYINETSVSLTKNKVYVVSEIVDGLYKIIDDTDESYLFYPEEFEVISE